MAMMQGDVDTTRLLIKGLMKRYPNSLMLKVQAANMMILDSRAGKPLIQLDDVPPPDPNDSMAQQFIRHIMRGVILSAQNKDPTPELLKAMECSPIDCMDARANLAGVYLQANPPRREEAVELYRQAYSYMSDTIQIVEQYEKLLNDLGRFKDADRLNERIYELDAVYRRRRGEAR